MSEENIEIARRAYEAFNRGGVEAILAFLDPEIEWRMAEEFTRTPRIYHGHEGVREVLGLFAEGFDNFRVEPEEFIEAGEQVIVPVRMTGLAKGSGEPVEVRLAQVWTARGGRAVRLEAYRDREAAWMALQSRAR